MNPPRPAAHPLGVDYSSLRSLQNLLLGSWIRGPEAEDWNRTSLRAGGSQVQSGARDAYLGMDILASGSRIKRLLL